MDLAGTALDLRIVARRIYQAIVTGDVARIEPHVSSRFGRLLIGARSPRSCARIPEFLRACQAEILRAGGRTPLISSSVEAQVEGSLGWIRDTPTILSAAGERVSFRLAALLRWEDGDWKLIELRFSPPEERITEAWAAG
jgi:hypothetical protein